MKFEARHTEELFNLMRWRRDVRHFTRAPVSPEHIGLLRRALALAPSVGNSRPWRVVSVDTPEVRDRIIANHVAANKSAAEIYDGVQRAEYCQLKLAGLEEAPLQLAIFTEVAPIEGHGLGRQTMPETLTHSTILAIHGLWLAARSLNLGLGWVSILDPGEVSRVLDVNPDWRLTAYLCIGHPAFDDDAPELERVGWQVSCDADWTVR